MPHSGGENRGIDNQDHAAHRRTNDTWLRWRRDAGSGCTRVGLRSGQSHPEMLCGRPSFTLAWRLAIFACGAHLVEGMRLDLREFVLHVIRIHGTNLLSRGCAEYFDDLDELVDAGLAGEKWLPQHQFGHDTTGRPHVCPKISRPLSRGGSRGPLTNLRGVIRCAKDQLRSTIVSRTDIRYVGLVFDQDFGATEVTELQHSRVRVQ